MGVDAKVIEQVKKQNGKRECLLWEFVKKYLAKSEDDERVSNVFAMAVYGMVIFSKVLDHIEAIVVNLVEQVNNQANPVLTIIA